MRLVLEVRASRSMAITHLDCRVGSFGRGIGAWKSRLGSRYVADIEVGVRDRGFDGVVDAGEGEGGRRLIGVGEGEGGEGSVDVGVRSEYRRKVVCHGNSRCSFWWLAATSIYQYEMEVVVSLSKY